MELRGEQDDPEEFPYGEVADYLEDVDAEESQFEADMKFFLERRRRYLTEGRIPTVPPSLSLDPHDPEFEFRGYMNVRTDEDGGPDALPEQQNRSKSPATPPSEPEASDGEFAADGDGGVFVNAAGESWAWHPTNIEDRLLARRLLRGGPDNRSVDATHADPGESTEAQAEGMGFRKIIGTDNRKMRSLWEGWDMTRFPWRVIGALVSDGDNLDGLVASECTAWKYGERHLMTAAHCVFDRGGGVQSLKLRDWWPGADGISKVKLGGDPTPNHYKNILWYWAPSRFIDKGWNTRDYAILILYDNRNSCAFGGLGYRVDYSLAGQQYWSFGYPGQLKICPASSPVFNDYCLGSMWGMYADIDSTTAYYAYVDHDAQKGQSGSPIYDFNKDGYRQVVAIMQANGYRKWDNRAIKIRKRVFDAMEALRDVWPSSYCSY